MEKEQNKKPIEKERDNNNVENIQNKKRKRTKRLSRSEEEKRVLILTPILNKWVVVKNPYEEGEYYYLKHVLANEGKFSRLKQILICNFPEQNGIYEISDYDVSYVFDADMSKKKIELKITKFDLIYGLYSENEFAETSQELITKLVELGYLTYDEFKSMKKDKDFHKGRQEMLLSFVKNNRRTKDNLRKEVE